MPAAGRRPLGKFKRRLGLGLQNPHNRTDKPVGAWRKSFISAVISRCCRRSFSTDDGQLWRATASLAAPQLRTLPLQDQRERNSVRRWKATHNRREVPAVKFPQRLQKGSLIRSRIDTAPDFSLA